MKKALLGLSNNIKQNFDKIKVWSKSFKKYSESDVILLCANSTEEELSLCKSIGIKPISVKIDNQWFINHKRLERTFEFLKNTDIDLFLITDVFDVVFQGDPFKKMDLKYDVFVSGEGVLVSEEPWNSDNISKIFPNEIKKCLTNEVICSGVIGGKRESLINLYQEMFSLCEKGSDNHNIKDQAALIVMITNKQIPNLKIFNLDDGWAMHCAVAGPTQFFDSWGFRNKLKYGIPYLDSGVVFTKQSQRFDIVHQFNRIPEWNNVLIKDYV